VRDCSIFFFKYVTFRCIRVSICWQRNLIVFIWSYWWAPCFMPRHVEYKDIPEATEHQDHQQHYIHLLVRSSLLTPPDEIACNISETTKEYIYSFLTVYLNWKIKLNFIIKNWKNKIEIICENASTSSHLFGHLIHLQLLRLLKHN
jgi:hypothetical protein